MDTIAISSVVSALLGVMFLIRYVQLDKRVRREKSFLAVGVGVLAFWFFGGSGLLVLAFWLVLLRIIAF